MWMCTVDFPTSRGKALSPGAIVPPTCSSTPGFITSIASLTWWKENSRHVYGATQEPVWQHQSQIFGSRNIKKNTSYYTSVAWFLLHITQYMIKYHQVVKMSWLYRKLPPARQIKRFTAASNLHRSLVQTGCSSYSLLSTMMCVASIKPQLNKLVFIPAFSAYEPITGANYWQQKTIK